MAESAYPFDTVPVYEAQWGEMAQLWARSGVVGTTRTSTDPTLRVTLGTGLTVNVAPGPAWVRGHYYTSDATVTRTGSTNTSTNPRIDRVVLRLDTTANTITPTIIEGTPATSPVPPALTRTATVHDIPLARMTCPGSGSAQNYTNLVDERQFTGPGVIVADVGGPSTSDVLPADPGALWYAPNAGRLAVGRSNGTWGLLSAPAPITVSLTGDTTVGDTEVVLATVTLPDLGCAYRVMAWAQCEVWAPAGTRADFWVRMGSSTGADLTMPGFGSATGDGGTAQCLPIANGPWQGQQIVYFVGRRVFGEGEPVALGPAGFVTVWQVPV